MSDKEILDIAVRHCLLTIACKDSLFANTLIAFARAVEAKLKEANRE